MAEYTEEDVEAFMKKVGERIQQVREFRGLTRREFGEAMGLRGESANTGVYALEAHGRGTRIDTIYKAAHILNVSPGFLLDGGELKVERVVAL
jgi:transcriptional regulator with XRE-family HTH domain